MNVLFPLILCFLPLIFAYLLFSFGFKIKITHQLITSLLSLAALIPISIIQYIIPQFIFINNANLLLQLVKSIVIYGLIEEAIKLVFLIPAPHKDYTLKNFLFLSFISGLTLGCFESVIYFLDHLQKSNIIGGTLLYKQIFIRIFTSDLLHTFCAGLLGIFLFTKRDGRKAFSLIFLSVFIHGLYDFFAGFNNSLSYFSIAVILFAAIECRVKYLSNIED